MNNAAGVVVDLVFVGLTLSLVLLGVRILRLAPSVPRLRTQRKALGSTLILIGAPVLVSVLTQAFGAPQAVFVAVNAAAAIPVLIGLFVFYRWGRPPMPGGKGGKS